MTLETELRDRLASAAGRADRWDDDWAAADDVIDRRRGEKRRRAVSGAAVACAAAVVVLVPVLTGGLGADSSAPPAGGATATATATAEEVWSGPTRGSLARDEAFRAAVTTLGWAGQPAHPPLQADRRVVFAGDLAGHRWALVAGEVDGQLQGTWYVGSAGTPAGLLQPIAGPQQLGTDGVASAVAVDPGTGMPDEVLVLARPGDQVSFSSGLTVDADGRVHRDYTPADVRDGVATQAVPPSASLTYQVERAGARVAGERDAWSTVQLDGLEALTAAPPLRPSAGTATEAAVYNAVAPVLTALGRSAAELHPVLLWHGELPRASGGSSSVVSVAVTLPSGAVVVGTGTDEGESGGYCGASVLPAGTALTDVVVAAECRVRTTTQQHWLVVSAPPSSTGSTLLAADGQLLRRPPLSAGAAVLEDPDAVATVGVDGVPGSVTVTSQNRDPLTSPLN